MKVLNFLLRMVFGAIGIQIINAILISQNISVFVGLNVLTLLTVGSLGISGLGLLFTGLRRLEFCEFFTMDKFGNKGYTLYLRSIQEISYIWLVPEAAQPVSLRLIQTTIPVWKRNGRRRVFIDFFYPVLQKKCEISAFGGEPSWD